MVESIRAKHCQQEEAIDEFKIKVARTKSIERQFNKNECIQTEDSFGQLHFN
jgi:hypothetical protein